MSDIRTWSHAAVNFICFQIGWFSCVQGAAHNLPWLGPLMTIPLVALHLQVASDRRSALALLLVGAVCGSLFDQALLSAGLVAYPTTGWPAWLLPPWMLSLWLLFCTTLNISLRWMRGSYAIAALFGAIGGPLAYHAGSHIGAMLLLNPEKMTFALILGWGLLLPVFVWLAARLDGFVPPAGAEHTRSLSPQFDEQRKH